jgi:hypothetical protein
MATQTAQRPASATSAAAGNGGNKPIHSVRHRNIKATIWKNETANGPMYNVNVVRAYRDDSGEWKDSHSIGYDDLMNVAALMYEAHAYLSELRAKEYAGRSQPTRRGQ